jgi:tetratricopeptide (TPR) repeat protein
MAEQLMREGISALKHARNTDDLEEVEKKFQKASNLAPWWPDPYYNLGLVTEQLRKFEEAISIFELYLLAAPDSQDADAIKQKISDLKYAKKDMAEVDKHIKSAGVYFKSQDYDQTIQEAKAAIQLDPDSGDAHGWLGLAYQFKKRDREAIVEMTEALRLGFGSTRSPPDWIGFYTNLGVSYARLGDKKKAIAVLKEGLAMAYSGNRGMAYSNLGGYCFDTGQYNEAIEAYEKALVEGYSNKEHVQKWLNKAKQELGR